MSRTPRDSAYMRVAAGGEYDADWEEHYAPPPPPKLKRAAQAPKTIATVGLAGADRWTRDDYTADPYQSFAPLEVDSELSSSEDGTPRKATVQPTPPRESPVDVWARRRLRRAWRFASVALIALVGGLDAAAIDVSRSASLRRPRLAGGLLVHDAAVLAAPNAATDDAELRRGRPAPRMDVQGRVRALRRHGLEQRAARPRRPRLCPREMPAGLRLLRNDCGGGVPPAHD